MESFEVNTYPGQWLTLPVSEWEHLHAEIKRLQGLIESHCDTSVSKTLSGLGVPWICEAELSDLRETLRKIEEDYELIPREGP